MGDKLFVQLNILEKDYYPENKNVLKIQSLFIKLFRFKNRRDSVPIKSSAQSKQLHWTVRVVLDFLFFFWELGPNFSTISYLQFEKLM